MKKPLSPPSPAEHISGLPFDTLSQWHAIVQQDDYRHWDTLRHKTPPSPLTNEQWWALLKIHRLGSAKQLPLCDMYEKPFIFNRNDVIDRHLHDIDMRGGGQLSSEQLLSDQQIRKNFVVRSWIEEAIESSIFEGAATTRVVARDMLRRNRQPRDKHERMICNNYAVMQNIREYKNEPLSADLIKTLHAEITAGTLDDSADEGRFRTRDDICVVSHENVLHRPPPSATIAERIDKLCAFANMLIDDYFLHPILKAIVLHFMIGYEHPFVDGNGRTARALFYWSAARDGYWLMEYLAISRQLTKAPAKYLQAFLYTETDDNDLTYFFSHQLGVIRAAMDDLTTYLHQQISNSAHMQAMLKGSRLARQLNSRQLALLHHAMQHPNYIYHIAEHQREHNVSYPTARKDLLTMAEDFELLNIAKTGNKLIFIAPANLHERIRQANDI